MNRKSVIKIWIVATVMVFSFTSCEREKIISSSDLPSEITSYISTHFPNNVIIQVVLERDGLTKTYDILLSESISLEFNRKKEIIDIDGVTQLPNSVIPEKILQYVNTNYPTNFITDWELEYKNQQVQLDNGLNLEFNMNGDFLRIDN
ncbi:MAG TPA: PepSY-like domain-containing protein [Bacteroidales bacterium]|nr:PepSY-like domain-containing protein [Bacteroidales bacterium]HPA11848.1 PepSY-like domain-containing protein [Bacteroidales bacterium]HQO06977.1 PepSY-like domain-containing protein [Bacteroidales bacterium]HQP52818.1 PepSY-like domain-containing protein [Bacteroidales bacterium]